VKLTCETLALLDDHPALPLASKLGLLDCEQRLCGERAEEIDIPPLERSPPGRVDRHQSSDGRPLGAQRHDQRLTLRHLTDRSLSCTRRPRLGSHVEGTDVPDDAGAASFVDRPADAGFDRLLRDQDSRVITARRPRVQAAKDECSSALAYGSHDGCVRADQPAPEVSDEPPHRRWLLAGEERLRDFDRRLEALLTGDELDNAVRLAAEEHWVAPAWGRWDRRWSRPVSQSGPPPSVGHCKPACGPARSAECSQPTMLPHVIYTPRAQSLVFRGS